MEILIFPTLGFVLLGIIAYKQSRGFVSIPTVCVIYFTFLYMGGLRRWFQVYSDTYLYVLAAAASFIAGVTLARALQRSRPVADKRSESDAASVPSSFRSALARGMRRLRSRETIAKKQEIYIGLHPQVFLYTLVTLTLTSIGIWAYWIWVVGVPLITSGNPSVGWVETGAGATNRLLGSLGGGNLVFVALGWYALYRVRRNRLYLLLASGCLVGGIFYMAFLGSKGSAVTTFLWFSIALFYLHRRTPKLKTFVLMGLIALPVTWWVASYYINSPGQSSLSIIYNRMTTGELEGLDFLVQTWVPRYGLMHGHTFSMDIERIKSQFLGTPRPVVFHEYIKNLLNGTSPYKSTRLSESLTLFGLGYVNFGWLGGVLFMMMLGGVCEALDSYLMTAKRIHFILFVIGIYSINSLLVILTSGDIFIVGLEQLLITLLPKLLLLVGVFSFFGLPFRIPLRWSGSSGKWLDEAGRNGRRAGLAGNSLGRSPSRIPQDKSKQEA